MHQKLFSSEIVVTVIIRFSFSSSGLSTKKVYSVHSVSDEVVLGQVLLTIELHDTFSDIFEDKLGLYVKIKARMYVQQ
uniref:Uncharacterized protein n=1 Tax=Schistosoma mansoni TaxID=6183 RepID=A0A5K4FB49_SCHMA